MEPIIIVLVVIVLCALVLVKKALVIIPQSETKIIERLGRYHATLNPGINIIIPFIDRAKDIVILSRGRYMYSTTIDLREQVYDFPKQNVITKDNVQTEINALLYFQIVDPFKAAYEISNLPNAIERLTQAERNKRATILTSEGKKAADILQSEGEKTAIINKAEAAKQEAILNAEGEALARIRKAEAEAKAIELITEAVGKSTNPANYLLAQKYIQMLEQLAQGDNQKTVYLPYEATNLMGSIGGIKDLFKSE